MNPDENPFWGEPTPTDLWEDMEKLKKEGRFRTEVELWTEDENIQIIR